MGNECDKVVACTVYGSNVLEMSCNIHDMTLGLFKRLEDIGPRWRAVVFGGTLYWSKKENFVSYIFGGSGGERGAVC